MSEEFKRTFHRIKSINDIQLGDIVLMKDLVVGEMFIAFDDMRAYVGGFRDVHEQFHEFGKTVYRVESLPTEISGTMGCNVSVVTEE